MKQKFLSFSIVALCAGLAFAACKKSNDANDKEDVSNLEMATQADDESMLSAEVTASVIDVNTLLELSPVFSGNYAVLTQPICDASVDVNTESDPMTITITYNGEACSAKKTRTGTVVISMAKNSAWVNEGAAITVAYQNFKITRTSDHKSVTINGSYQYTNVSGKLLNSLADNGPIVHTLTSDNMSVSFDDSTATTWHVARKHTFTYDNGGVLSITGTHTQDNISGIAEWGENRFGNAFTTVVSTPVVVRQSCDMRITSGVVTHSTPAYVATITLGLNQDGSVASSCPAENESYFYLLECATKKGAHFSIILPY